MPEIYERYIVWVYYGSTENWVLSHNTDDFEDAVKMRESALKQGQDAIITEIIPLVVSDGRSKQTK